MKNHCFSNLSLREVKNFIENNENVAFGFLNKKGTKVEASPILPKSFKLSLSEDGKELSVEYYTLKSKGNKIEVVDFATPCIMEFKKTELYIGCVGSKNEDDFNVFNIER
jgi:hypothetical protein